MIFGFFSAYALSETETNKNVFQFRSGLFNKPTEILLPIPREILSRTFPFVFLQHLAILEIAKQKFTSPLDLNKTGVLCGSATGGISQLSLQQTRFSAKGITKISPLTVPLTIHNSASSVLAIEHKIKGISSGYNCMETSGVEALSDAIALINSNETDSIFVGSGEDLTNEKNVMQQVGGVLLLTRFKPQDIKFYFEIECVLNRGKSWLSSEENLKDVLNEYFSANLKSNLKKEKWLLFNFQEKEINIAGKYPLEIVEFPQFMPYLSLAPFLGMSQGMDLYQEFKLLTVSSEGHAVLLNFKKVNC